MGLLYTLAKYKILGEKALPEDVAKTSQPQTWHAPRGDKLRGIPFKDIEVRGFSRPTPVPEGMSWSVKSTLYNPIRGQGVDWKQNLDQITAADKDMLILPALGLTNVPTETRKRLHGQFIWGTSLSRFAYEQFYAYCNKHSA